MGQFDGVPGLDEYNRRVQMNQQQDAGQMMKLSQLMQMAQQAQSMQQHPEDVAMKRQLQQAQMEQYRGNAAENQAQAQERQANAQKMQEQLNLGMKIASMPKDHPEREGMVQRWRMMTDPRGVFAEEKAAPLPWYVRKGPDGKMTIDPSYAEFERQKAGAGKPTTPYFTPVADATKGMGTFDNRTGRYTFDSSSPMVKPGDSPALQGQIAGAKGYGTESGKGQADAEANLPKAITNGENALAQINALRKHPGFGIAVGKTSMLGTQKIPGTAGYDFVNRLEQLKGGAFLTAFETLKGGGAITEVEGKKATSAIARMDNATSEGEFNSALNDYESVIKAATNNAKIRAAGKNKLPAAGNNDPASVPEIGGVLDGHVYLGGDPSAKSSWKKAAK